MKTLTCDKCGKEIKFGSNITKSQVTVDFEDKLVRVGGTNDLNELIIDLCPSCQGRLVRWVTDRDASQA